MARPFHFGSHCDDRSKNGETLKNVHISDCDILNADGDGILCMRCGDKNTLKNITFDNIRIEEVERGRLFNIQVYFSAKYNRAPGNSITDVTFRNITFTGDESKLSRSFIKHYDEKRTVSNIKLENITVNGRPFNPDWDLDVYDSNK